MASVVLAAGCSGGAPPPTGDQVAVTLRDFRIVASAGSLPAGVVHLQISNRGPSTHELVVMRTDLPADDLPLDSDGLTIDESSSLLRDIGELAEVPLGDSQTLAVTLEPGRYVLFCNLDGHYLGGMYLSMDVGRAGG